MKTLSRRRFIAASAATLSLAAAPSLLMPRPARADGHKVITAAKRTIEVKGRSANVFGLTQADGSHGLVMNADERFRVRLENRLGEPTAIHWHGLTPPWQQDGVAGICAGADRGRGGHDYDFPVAKPGTFWMHSHFGLQEQLLLAAPLIVRDPAEAGQDVQEVVVLFHDFTFRDPQEILTELKAGGHDMQAMADAGGHPDHAGHEGHDIDRAWAGVPDEPWPAWAAMAHLQDVQYDALLANDRTLDDPQVFAVEPGGRVRLRLINGAASTNMWVDLGQLSGKLIAVDGMPVEPVEGSRFEFAVAQRLDIVLELPREGSAWPIFAVQEGGRMRTGIVLAAKGATIGKFADMADEDFPAVGVDLEQKLRAAQPLAERQATRQHTMMLGEGPNYAWTLDGAVHGSDTPLAVQERRPLRTHLHEPHHHVAPHALARPPLPGGRGQRPALRRGHARHRAGAGPYGHGDHRLRRRQCRQVGAALPPPLPHGRRHDDVDGLRRLRRNCRAGSRRPGNAITISQAPLNFQSLEAL